MIDTEWQCVVYLAVSLPSLHCSLTSDLSTSCCATNHVVLTRLFLLSPSRPTLSGPVWWCEPSLLLHWSSSSTRRLQGVGEQTDKKKVECHGSTGQRWYAVADAATKASRRNPGPQSSYNTQTTTQINLPNLLPYGLFPVRHAGHRPSCAMCSSTTVLWSTAEGSSRPPGFSLHASSGRQVRYGPVPVVYRTAPSSTRHPICFEYSTHTRTLQGQKSKRGPRR